MAKDRDIPCKYYVSKGECLKGREAAHTGYCQKCDKYEPRSRKRPKNLRKKKNEKLEKNELLSGSFL